MTKNHFRALLVFVLSLAAAPAGAAPILLVEFKHELAQFGGFSNEPPDSALFLFSAAGLFGPPYMSWVEQYDTAEIGQTHIAPAEVVAGAVPALANASTVYGFVSADQGDPVIGTIGSFTPIGVPCHATACVYARSYVNDFTNFHVTSVERVINFLYTPTGFGTLFLEASQIVRFWGEPIPEPSVALLLCVATAHLCLSYRLRRPN